VLYSQYAICNDPVRQSGAGADAWAGDLDDRRPHVSDSPNWYQLAIGGEGVDEFVELGHIAP